MPEGVVQRSKRRVGSGGEGLAAMFDPGVVNGRATRLRCVRVSAASCSA